MRFSFRTQKLRTLYTNPTCRSRYPDEVVDAFFEVMAIIAAAPDDRELYQHPHLHYEKLQGARGKRGERSLRLYRQYRLIVSMGTDAEGRCCLVIDIDSKHYKE